MSEPQTFTLGLISDTHGLLRPEALALLRGVDRIIHAGDIGDPDLLERLGEIAPVSAVRGNIDDEKWAEVLPLAATLSVGGVLIHLLHSLADLRLNPAALGIRAVISGHSHSPLIETRQGVLFINPGSAGPRRFSLPVTVALLRVTGDTLDAQLCHIDVPAPAPRSPRRKSSAAH